MEKSAERLESGAHAEALAKAIADLDALIQYAITALPRTKPWHRQLVAQLSKVAQEIQVLRLTISMGRPEQELIDAANALRATCCNAHAAVLVSRADATTKAAVRLMLDLSQRICSGLGP